MNHDHYDHFREHVATDEGMPERVPPPVRGCGEQPMEGEADIIEPLPGE